MIGKQDLNLLVYLVFMLFIIIAACLQSNSMTKYNNVGMLLLNISDSSGSLTENNYSRTTIHTNIMSNKN